MAEQLAEWWCRRQVQCLLDRPVRLVGVTVFVVPRGQSQELPVGRAITSAAIAGGIRFPLFEFFICEPAAAVTTYCRVAVGYHCHLL